MHLLAKQCTQYRVNIDLVEVHAIIASNIIVISYENECEQLT